MKHIWWRLFPLKIAIQLRVSYTIIPPVRKDFFKSISGTANFRDCMVGRQNTSVLFEIGSSEHCEELLPKCKCALNNCDQLYKVATLCVALFWTHYNLQKTDRADDWLINEMLRAVSFLSQIYLFRPNKAFQSLIMPCYKLWILFQLRFFKGHPLPSGQPVKCSYVYTIQAQFCCTEDLIYIL